MLARRFLMTLILLALPFCFAQQPGGTATVLLPEDLPTLNPYLSTAFITLQVSPAILEPLVGVDATGSYYPVLAAEVPSAENGGVSDDGLTVTWRLEENVVWSDGEPFSAEDVVFTFNTAADPGSGSVRSGAYERVAAVEALDEHTVRVTYSEFDSSYLDAFQWGILPQHASGAASEMANWPSNRAPVGTGPFILAEWRSGDRLILTANPNYREEGKPYLERVVFLVMPSQETRAAMMTRGEAHVMLWPGSELRPVFEEAGNVRLDPVESIWILRMFLNLGERGNPTEGQAPHPVLGDVRVRQALAYGIDYELLVEVLAEGRVTRATSPFALGWYACDVSGYAYDPERARALLEEAGWVPGPDGIRIKDGLRLSLEMVGYTDFRLLEQTELVIADLYRDIGVELSIRNIEQSVLFGGWGDRAARKTGDYDILIYDTGAGINPQLHVEGLLHSRQIPTEENGGFGANYSRWANARADELLDLAGRTPSLDARRDAYCEVAELVNEELPQIYLYQFQENHAVASNLQGLTMTTWAGLAWDMANWWLE